MSDGLRQRPSVSVVIPTMLLEGREQFLRETLDSVLAQSFQDFEIVLVHNGTDSAWSARLGDYRDSVRYVYSPVGNIGEARNLGVREASGEYIAFLDDDDLWTPDKLELQHGVMRSNPDIDMLFSDTELFTSAGVVHSSYMRHVGGLDLLSVERRQPQLLVQQGDWFAYLIRYAPFLPSCWMAKRSVLAESPFLPAWSEDRELLSRLARTHRLAVLDRVLTRKRDHDSNASLNMVEECTRGVIAIAQAAAKWDLQDQERAVLRRWEADARFELGYLLRRDGRHLPALNQQVKSLWLSPDIRSVKETVKNLCRWRGTGSARVSRPSG